MREASPLNWLELCSCKPELHPETSTRELRHTIFTLKNFTTSSVSETHQAMQSLLAKCTTQSPLVTRLDTSHVFTGITWNPPTYQWLEGKYTTLEAFLGKSCRWQCGVFLSEGDHIAEWVTCSMVECYTTSYLLPVFCNPALQGIPSVQIPASPHVLLQQ